MERGEVYGALLKRLNQGIVYVNCNSIEEEIVGDCDDVKRELLKLWENGIVRRINKDEYELSCTIEQLREYIIQADCVQVQNKDIGDFDKEGDKPITLEELSDSLWNRVVEKEESDKERSKRTPFNARMRDRRHPSRSSRYSSIFDDDEYDDDEDDETRRKMIFALLQGAANVNMEERTLVPFMTVHFEGSDKKLVLGWNTDDDGDYYLTDKGLLYEYFLERLEKGKVPDAELLVKAIINKLGRDTSFAVDGKEIKNYLTGVNNKDDFYSEISYYAIQYGRLFERLQSLFKPLDEQKELTQECFENLSQKFVESVEIPNIFYRMAEAERFSTTMIKRILKIDPRITKEQAITVANKIKKKWLENDDQGISLKRINDVISELNCLPDTVFINIKANAYFDE